MSGVFEQGGARLCRTGGSDGRDGKGLDVVQ